MGSPTPETTLSKSFGSHRGSVHGPWLAPHRAEPKKRGYNITPVTENQMEHEMETGGIENSNNIHNPVAYVLSISGVSTTFPCIPFPKPDIV